MLGSSRLATKACEIGSDNISGRVDTPVVKVITGIIEGSAATQATVNLAGYGQWDGQYTDGADQQCKDLILVFHGRSPNCGERVEPRQRSEEQWKREILRVNS
jgi:hypothetical protein